MIYEQEFSERLTKAIPGGCHTYSRGDDQFPQNAPKILSRGKDSYVWDSNGKKYLDYAMGLRSVSIGYSNDEINQAAYEQIINGNNLSRASMIELQAAELLVDTIPFVDMVKFAKNGSNATTGALKLARSFTGRKFVAICAQNPFFSFDDWFIGTTPIEKGIPKEHSSLSLKFNYNDIESLKKLFDEYPNQIAAVILEPATSVLNPISNMNDSQMSDYSPANNSTNFLQLVRNECDKNGTLLVFDEIITGFRWHKKGASEYYQVYPDIVTYGKAIANGFSLAVIGGRRDIMEMGAINKIGAERTFLMSTTYGAEMSSLGAMVKTLEIINNSNVPEYYWDYGKKLKNGLNAIADSLGILDYFFVEGHSVSPVFTCLDKDKKISLALRTLFVQEMIKMGVIFHVIVIAHTHGEEELKLTLNAAEHALKVYKLALENGYENYLVGNPVKPVFRQFN